MAWIWVVLAGLLEIGWAAGLKASEGLTRPWPTALTALMLAGSMWLMAIAAKTLPLGTAYAIWVGIGAAGTAVVSAMFFDEPLSRWQVGFLLLLIVALGGLKLTAPQPQLRVESRSSAAAR